MNLWKEKGIYFIDEYYPYWITDSNNQKIKNTYFEKGKGKYILSLKNNKKDGIEYYTNKLISILLYKIKNINEFDVITYVPSSKKDKNNLGLEKVLKNICDNYNHLEFKRCLNRIESIEKLATGGNRNKEIHVKTIDINDSKEIKDKNIIIIDDVTSTGNSMIACKQKLKDAGANKVACLSLSKTYNNLEEACNDNKSLKALNELDNTIQNYINNLNIDKRNGNYEKIINSIIEKFLFFRESFKIYDKNIKDKYEIMIRKRELYLYLINQINILENLEYTLVEYLDISKTLLVKIIIYNSLIEENNNLDLLSNYFEEVRLFRKNYGYECDLENLLGNYRGLINIYLREYETDGYSLNLNLNSTKLNYIAKALYESNTELSLRNALNLIDKAIELDKTEMELYLNRAIIYIKLNKFEKVINDIKSALNLEKKVYSNIIPFKSNKSNILEWLKELNKISNSSDISYLLAMYMYKIYSPEEGLITLKNQTLTKNEMKILELIAIANEKSKGEYSTITKIDIFKQRKIKNLDSYKHLNKNNKQYIYYFPETIVDILNEQENEVLRSFDDYYSEDIGPDWLGGCESEAEFWEHT
ncbi:phosphoribosyltransferase family protein [Clostridium nigeriense]|uniref:phosphoribosyltransferase family protein n=1 Tax=Clostridium nigeriense TaxID=1805470 RepID=UPI003D331FE6